MAGELVLVWGLHCYLRAMYLIYAMKQLKRKKVNKNKEIKRLFTHLLLYIKQFCPVYIYLSQGLILLYVSPPVQKLHLHGNITSQPYKSTFHSGHLLATCLMAVMHLSRYSVFYNRDTSN